VQRLDLQPGERFLAVAHPGLFDELIPHDASRCGGFGCYRCAGSAGAGSLE
jgi:hypothetical protein